MSMRPELIVLLLLMCTAAHAASDEALTCRFEFEQSFTKPDMTSPGAFSGSTTQTYTLIFNRLTRTGKYIEEYGSIGTGSGEIKLLEGRGRLTFYENVSGNNLFFISVFNSEKLPDERYPAVISSHVWWSGIKNKTDKEIFLPEQMIGGCR